MYIGPHIHFSGDFKRLIDLHKLTGCTLFQIFRKSDNKIKNLDLFLKYINKHDIKVVVHSSYSSNIAANWDKNTYWMLTLEEEVSFCNKVGAFGLVIHFGKSMELKIADGYNNMFTSLIYLHHKTLNMLNVKLILETPAGQGTEMCSHFDDLVYFYNKFKINDEIYNRIKLCIDTCHIFSAGYDVRTYKYIREYLKLFNQKIGISNLVLVHLNDSKTPLGGQLDRHEILGKGYIGKKGMLSLFKFFEYYDIPMVIETYRNYVEEVKFLLQDKEKNDNKYKLL
jgi:deoxyribonuclease-4